jgi:hypothetical protein
MDVGTQAQLVKRFHFVRKINHAIHQPLSLGLYEDYSRESSFFIVNYIFSRLYTQRHFWVKHLNPFLRDCSMLFVKRSGDQYDKCLAVIAIIFQDD